MDLFRVFRREFKSMYLDEQILDKILELQESVETIYKKFSNNYYDYQEYVAQTKKRIYSIENSFKLIKRIYQIFHNIYFAKAQKYENYQEEYISKKPTRDQRIDYDIIKQLLHLLHQISSIVTVLEVDFNKENKFKPKNNSIYKELENELEKTIKVLNKNYSNKNELIKRIKNLIENIKQHTEKHSLRLKGKVIQMEFHRHEKKNKLLILQDIPFLELSDIRLRSHFRFELHADKGLLEVKHYNLVFKDGRNIHVIPREEDKNFEKFLKKYAA